MNNNSTPFYNASLNKSSVIMLDTSFILNWQNYNDSAVIAQECDDFMFKVATSSAMLVINSVCETEIYNIYLREGLKKELPGGFKEGDVKALIKDNPNTYTNIIEVAERKYNDTISSLQQNKQFFNDILIPTENTNKTAISLFRKYSLPGLNDAVQLAIALEQGVSHFATTDSDFNRIAEDNLHILVDEKTHNKG